MVRSSGIFAFAISQKVGSQSMWQVKSISLEDCQRLILCSGKIYYDLIEERDRLELSNVAIMRIEQLYPLSIEEIRSSIQGLPNGSEILWVQDEPTNMGAWPYIKFNFGDELNETYQLKRVSRVESASPSTGSLAAHKLEHAELMEQAFAGI
jgi:2-oxoglutarate dehydrogenase E1 component